MDEIVHMGETRNEDELDYKMEFTMWWKVTTYMENDEMDKIDITSNAMTTWMKLKQQHKWSSWPKMELIAWMKKYHLDELVNLNGIVHIDGFDDTCNINNHSWSWWHMQY
jgi:hypothetical protein